MNGLSDKEKTVLGCAELRAGASVRKIAELTGYKEHTVRYALDGLRQRKVIGNSQPFINVYGLGYSEFVVYFSMSVSDPAKRQSAIDYLTASELVPWLSELGGNYEYALSCYTTHVNQLSELLFGLLRQEGPVISKKLINVRVSYTYYGRRYLDKNQSSGKSFVMSIAGESLAADANDMSVLALLSHPDQGSIEQRIDKSEMSRSTFKRRTSELESKGAIQGYFLRVNAGAYGMQRYRLRLATRVPDSHLRELVISYAQSDLSVVYIVEWLGHWDYELGVEVVGQEEAMIIARKLQKLLSDRVDDISVIAQFAYLKQQLFPFRPPSDPA